VTRIAPVNPCDSNIEWQCSHSDVMFSCDLTSPAATADMPGANGRPIYSSCVTARSAAWGRDGRAPGKVDSSSDALATALVHPDNHGFLDTVCTGSEPTDNRLALRNVQTWCAPDRSLPKCQFALVCTMRASSSTIAAASAPS
jgi:hypothetical protein